MSSLRLFTSESVTEGHPDKICDQISDSILDALLAVDPGSRVAVETLVTTGLVHVAGQGSIAWALGRLPAPTASVVVLVQPVVAALLGWLLFREALGPQQALGGALVLAGVLLAQAAGRPRGDQKA